VAGLLLVTSCQRPTPSVTLQSGSRSMHAEATAYVRDGRQTRGSTSSKVLLVRPGALVGIDVDGSIADAGWQVHITTPTGTGSTTSTQDSSTLKGQHHFAFNVGAVTTQIVISELGSGSTPKGLWFFTLQPSLN
jgi:3D (Asp-Asp-Asp) domain-containing protein